jgi:hypothetical protein
VLMCADCQAARGRGSGPYPVMPGRSCAPAWTCCQPGHWSRRRPPTARSSRSCECDWPLGSRWLACTRSRGWPGWSAKPRSSRSWSLGGREQQRMAQGHELLGGETRLWPASLRDTWWRLRWRADLRFLSSRGDRSCPLQSSTCRLRVYPLCTGGLGPVWPRAPPALRSSRTRDRSISGSGKPTKQPSEVALDGAEDDGDPEWSTCGLATILMRRQERGRRTADDSRQEQQYQIPRAAHRFYDPSVIPRRQRSAVARKGE